MASADQRHHAGLAVAQLAREPPQERPAAVEIDDTGEPEQGVGRAWKGEPLIQPEERLNHRREQQDRDGERERYPEPAAEVRDHGAVIGVPGVIRGMMLAAGAADWRRGRADMWGFMLRLHSLLLLQ